MKNLLRLILISWCLGTVNANDIVQFRLSKPYCILNFMETTIRASGTSSTLKKYIDGHVKNDSAFPIMVNRYREIRLDYNYTRDEYPENRHRNRSTQNLINVAAVQSSGLDDLKTRTIGILPNSEHRKLFEILRQAETYYDRIIWNEYSQKITMQMKELEKNKEKIGELFITLRHFYGSDWSSDVPFIVAVYPIPGRKGNTTATPNGNSLCVGVLTDETDYAGRTGVIMHEMCHVLYDEQPNALQHRLEYVFRNNASAYKNYAYNFFDEGLATALGNGWCYERLTGTTDTTSWYDNAYIDGFGHVLYPLVKEYIALHRSIDSIFITRAIEGFAEKFPKANTDYAILLNKLAIYSDAETEAERNEMMATLYGSFQITSSNSSSPILHEYSIRSLKENSFTQLIIIDRNSETNLNRLKQLFPEIKGMLKNKTASSWILSFFDKKNRPVIILKINTKTDLAKLVAAMHKKRHIDPVMPVMEF